MATAQKQNAIVASMVGTIHKAAEVKVEIATVDYSELAEKIVAKIESSPARSAWTKGVKEYAVNLYTSAIENLGFEVAVSLTEEEMLNGAENWEKYSWGGCSLVYDGDIAETLCTPSELKRTKGGALPPNSCEEWLDVQARALYQASQLVLNTIAQVKTGKIY